MTTVICFTLINLNARHGLDRTRINSSIDSVVSPTCTRPRNAWAARTRKRVIAWHAGRSDANPSAITKSGLTYLTRGWTMRAHHLRVVFFDSRRWRRRRIRSNDSIVIIYLFSCFIFLSFKLRISQVGLCVCSISRSSILPLLHYSLSMITRGFRTID